MLKEQCVTIKLVSGSNSEYIIKDASGITIGWAFIIELSKENRYCILRIKFYKSEDSSYTLLKNSLNMFMKILFINMNLNKINILVNEDINISAFIDSGFELEGIVSSTIKVNSSYKNELVFGLSCDEFKSISINKGLHIRGSNIDIKALTPQDAQDVLNYYIKNKEYLRKFEPTREKNFYTLDVQKRTLIESYTEFLNGRSVNFGIYKNSKFIGKIQISNIVIGVFKSAFIGYSIDEDEQGKGYMKESVKLALQYGFNEIGLHRIEASTLVDNIKSQSVLKSSGFKELGLNKNYLFIDGKWRDHLTFYKVNPCK